MTLNQIIILLNNNYYYSYNIRLYKECANINNIHNYTKIFVLLQLKYIII